MAGRRSTRATATAVLMCCALGPAHIPADAAEGTPVSGDQRKHTSWVAVSDPAHVDAPGDADAQVSDAAGAKAWRRAARSLAPTATPDTGALHSRPDASRVIHLDFDGHFLPADHAWVDHPVTGHPELADTEHPAWDPAGDGPALSQAEAVALHAIWEAVAEDFAPFDVDVTTQDPGLDGLVKSSPADTHYGAKAVITSNSPAQVLCTEDCSGIAFLGSFDAYERAGVAWVFNEGLSADIAYTADTISHEIGHNLGLGHHGGGGDDKYYQGHGGWAPIMGAGWHRPTTQWSRGDYAGANNPGQDDLALIGMHLPRRADEAISWPGDEPDWGRVAARLSPPPASTATITDSTDSDTWLLGECAPEAEVHVRPSAALTNLDARLTVRDIESHDVVATVDPMASWSSARAYGTDARWIASRAGWYAIEVAGTGVGTASTGYSAYGSLGDYRVHVSGCSLDAWPDDPPSAPVPPDPDPQPSDGADTRVPPPPSGATPAVKRSSRVVMRTSPPVRAGRTGRTVTVVVRTADRRARGKVRIRVGAQTRVVTLRHGRVRIRIPRGQRVVRVHVVYLGDATTSSSSGRRTVRMGSARAAQSSTTDLPGGIHS